VVDTSLSLGALVGVVLSAGFVYLEVGRFATPQVPVSLFDERRELFAYTAGLFVGVPLAVVFVLFVDAMGNGALPGGLLFLGLLVIGTEVAQWALLRTRYWGRDASGPFYALGYRASIGGILALALVAQYFGGPGPVTAAGVALVLLESVAVIGLEVAGALLSVRTPPSDDRRRGGPVSGGLFELAGFFLIGLGGLAGTAGAFLGAAVALLGGGLVYQRLRSTLAAIAPPGGRGPPIPSGPPAPFGRTGGRPPGAE
jgi:hypothetical protein